MHKFLNLEKHNQSKITKTENSQQLEAELSEDVNSVLKLFKRSITNFEYVFFNPQQSTETIAILYKIAEDGKLLLEISKKYKGTDLNFYILYLLLYTRMQNRLMIRLKEIIYLSKNRYGNGSLFKDIKSLIQQFDIHISFYEKGNDFPQFVYKIYTTVINLIRLIKLKLDISIDRSVHNNSFSIVKYSEVQQQRSKRINTLENQPKSYSNSNCLPPKNINLYQGLDIESNCLRDVIQNIKKSQFQIIHKNIDKNKIAQKQILSYFEDYCSYINRKREKRRFLSELKTKSKKENICNKMFIRMKTTVTPKKSLDINFRQKHRQITLETVLAHANNKAEFKMNQVYVSGDQFNYFNPHSSIFKYGKSTKNKKPSIFLARALRQTPKSNKSVFIETAHALQNN